MHHLGVFSLIMYLLGGLLQQKGTRSRAFFATIIDDFIEPYTEAFYNELVDGIC